MKNDLCVQPLHIEDIGADLLIGQPLKYAMHGTMAGVHEANHASLSILFASCGGEHRAIHCGTYKNK